MALQDWSEHNRVVAVRLTAGILGLLTILCLAATASISHVEGASLPDHVKKGTVDQLFSDPTVSSRLMLGPEGYREHLLARAFLIPKQFLAEAAAGPDPISKQRYFSYVDVEKLRPYITRQQGDVNVVLGQRKFNAIEYVNGWKEGVTEYWAVTFSYFIEPRLLGLPRLGPFKGKGVAMRHPSMDQWKYQASWGDRGGESYNEWLANEWRSLGRLVDLSGEWTGTIGTEQGGRLRMSLKQQDGRVSGSLHSEARSFIPDSFRTTDHCWLNPCVWTLKDGVFDPDQFLFRFEGVREGIHSGRYFLNVGISDSSTMAGGALVGRPVIFRRGPVQDTSAPLNARGASTPQEERQAALKRDTVSPQPMSPAVSQDSGSVQPRDTNAKIRVKFENRTSGTVQVFWLAGEGKETLYRELSPSEGYTQETYEKHLWQVRDKVTGQTLGTMMADSRAPTLVITSSGLLRGTPEELNAERSGGPSGKPLQSLAPLVGVWRGTTWEGRPLRFVVRNDGTYEAVVLVNGREVKGGGQLSVEGDKIRWLSRAGTVGSLSLADSSGKLVLRGTQDNSRNTFEVQRAK